MLQKETPWVWLPEHKLDFENTKKALTSPTTLQPFDPKVKTVVLTDASRLHDIGFTLVQVYKDRLALIQCGSVSLSPTQSRYSTMELECLAIVQAINKCHYYLAGITRFEVWTEHRPLVGAFTKHLHLLQNQRLMRMREKLTGYNFSVIWTPGKSHHIADALSRAPVFAPCDLSFEPEHLGRCLRLFDTSLTKMVPTLDDAYMETMKLVRSGKNATHIDKASSVYAYRRVIDQLCIEAKQLMLHTACDLFSAVGKQWLALFDRFSGYAWTMSLRRLDTKAVIQHLESWFNDFGWPTHIRTDGGPQFRSEFKQFCAAHGIQHELSSPCNPESNGLAEAAVKNLKSIVLRCTEKGENIQHAIAAWQNTSRQDGSSPAQLFFGRRQRLGLPLLPQHLEENHLQCTDAKNKEATRLHDKANTQATELPDLRPQERVWIQHHQTKDWYKQAAIIESRHNGRAYELVDDDGKTYYRGRRFLRPVQKNENRDEATVYRCYTTRTEEFADAAMESNKPSYAAILSHDKEEGRHKKRTNVYVDKSIRRPCSAPIDDIGQPTTQRTEPRIPQDSDGKQLFDLHLKKLRGQ